MYVLSWRELLLVTRNPTDVAGRVLLFCWAAVFIGLVFYDTANSLEGIRCAGVALATVCVSSCVCVCGGGGACARVCVCVWVGDACCV